MRKITLNMPDHKLEKSLSSHVICMHDMVLHTPCKPSYKTSDRPKKEMVKIFKSRIPVHQSCHSKSANGQGENFAHKINSTLATLLPSHHTTAESVC